VRNDTIHYIYPNSICAKVIEEIYNTIARPHCRSNSCFDFRPDTAIFYYIKPYEGILIGRKHGKVINFYDEREWRYVPFADNTLHNKEIPEDIDSMLAFDDWNDTNKREIENQKIQTYYKLDFSPNDITHLIVKEEAETLELAQKINSCAKYTYSEKDLLKTKIISMRKIRENF
jgi:hypothetical protein